MKPLFRLTIIGDPVPKGRPKFAVIGGHGRAYTPKRTREYEETIRVQAKLEGIKLLDPAMPVELGVLIFRTPPKSMRAELRKRIEAGDESIPVVVKPDLSNYVKLCEDALNDIAWRDQQIVKYAPDNGKFYSVQPRVVITAWLYDSLYNSSQQVDKPIERICRACRGEGCDTCFDSGIIFVSHGIRRRGEDDT